MCIIDTHTQLILKGSRKRDDEEITAGDRRGKSATREGEDTTTDAAEHILNRESSVGTTTASSRIGHLIVTRGVTEEVKDRCSI